ncbi:MAG TPA: hypothetical protein VHF05_02750 [Candidatus Paceibacterota bacterium]|jgi:hypothetical protein|nr:hypothetical protein [Candidatus Paceibacterota bacterium]
MNLTEAGNSTALPNISTSAKTALVERVKKILSTFDGTKVDSTEDISGTLDGKHIALTFKHVSHVLGSKIEEIIANDPHCSRFLAGEGEWRRDKGLTLRFRPHEHIKVFEQECVGAVS